MCRSLTTKKRILSFLLIGLFVSSCGGGSAGTGAFSGGVDEKRTLGSFTQQERDRFCSRFEEFARDKIPSDFSCTFSGIIEAADALGFNEKGSVAAAQNMTPVNTAVPLDPKQICEEDRDLCLVDPETIADAEPKCALASLPALQSCGVTAGQVEQCFNDEVQFIEAIGNRVTCDSAGDRASYEEIRTALFTVLNSPSCTALEQQCPNIFDND